jgi:Tol biopolymer transport system component
MLRTRFTIRRALSAAIWFAISVLVISPSFMNAVVSAQTDTKKNDKKEDKKDEKKDDKKKAEPFPVKKLTQGLGFYGVGPVSPDGKHLLLLGQKADSAPNVYTMDLADFAIQAPLTRFKWGAGDPQWSPDGSLVALAGFGETASFSDLYLVAVNTGKLVRLTSNSFTDKDPVFTPNGKRVLFTTDESPLPDAAFGILHVASVAVAGGKSEYFTEDEVSSIRPCISSDGKSVFLIQINEHSGRHSLWQYGLDGKPQRDLTERKFARIHQYIPNAQAGTIIIWGQEEIEQQDTIYILDFKTREVRELPDPDLPKRSPTVSPSGKLIAFVAPTGTGAQLFLFDSSTGQIQQVTHKGQRTHSPVFISNDKVLFGSDRDKANELYLLDLAPPPPPAEEKKKK